MKDCADDERDQRGTKDATSSEEKKVGPCDSAHVAETYRLESPDEACDDGIR